MDIEDDSDEVIYEFDLNLSTTKCDLFEFSAKDYPFNETKRNTTLESIKVKPNAKQFEFNLQFEKSDSLSEKKNNELLIVNEKMKLNEDRSMKFKVLKSNYLQETKIKYGLCYVTKTKRILDVIPIDNVFDFQTDFTYLENDDRIKLKDKSTKDDYSTNSINQLNEIDSTKLTKSSSKSDSIDQIESISSPNELQNFTLRYETSFEYSPWSHVNYVNLKEKTSKEPWKILKLINKSKDIKNLGKKKVNFCDNSMNESTKSTNSSIKYSLLPIDLINKQNDSDLNSISLTKINKLQLNEKINKLLYNCIVIPFSRLIHLVANDLEKEKELIIKMLQKSAMLVQGNWVIKSEVLYPSTDQTELAIIHDFVSFCFTKFKQLKRQNILSEIKFPNDSLLTILKRLARFNNETRSWHFLYPTDLEFIREHENINLQMEISWEIRKLQIFKNLNEKFREKSNKRKQAPIKKLNEEHKMIKKRLRKRKTKV